MHLKSPKFYSWSGRSPEERNDNPLWYSCLENSIDRGAWQATVHGVAELDMTECAHTHTHTHTQSHPGTPTSGPLPTSGTCCLPTFSTQGCSPHSAPLTFILSISHSLGKNKRENQHNFLCMYVNTKKRMAR